MTDEQTTEPVADAPAEEELSTAVESSEATADEQDSPNREAAKYRTKLREAESERDTLRSRLDAAHRQLVEHHLTDSLADPNDYWLRGGQVPLTDDGALDTDALDDQVKRIIDDAPHLRVPRKPLPNPAQGASASGTSHDEKQGPTWGDVLKRR